MAPFVKTNYPFDICEMIIGKFWYINLHCATFSVKMYVLYHHPTTHVNMVLNVHRNHKAYQGRGEGGAGGMEVVSK